MSQAALDEITSKNEREMWAAIEYWTKQLKQVNFVQKVD